MSRWDATADALADVQCAYMNRHSGGSPAGVVEVARSSKGCSLISLDCPSSARSIKSKGEQPFADTEHVEKATGRRRKHNVLMQNWESERSSGTCFRYLDPLPPEASPLAALGLHEHLRPARTTSD